MSNASLQKASQPGSTRPNPLGFAAYVGMRFMNDGCQQRAASLTFTSLLALVPLFAVSFAIFEAFPAYARMKGQVQSMLFDNMIPQVGQSIQSHLDEFTQRTGELTAIGILFLIVSAVALMLSISGAFDTVWRAQKRRNFVARLLVFWAMITLTPMLFGASLTISSYLFTIARQSGVEEVTGSLTNFGVFLPFILQTIGFTALFVILPNHPVRKTDALAGGATAAVLFEGLKKAFALYITTFPTYQTIYGALATIPIFLLWVYVSWIIVLLAAELTAALPEWRAGYRNFTKGESSPQLRLITALSILSSLKVTQERGEGLRERQLLRATGFGPTDLSEAERRLMRSRYIARGEKGEWLLVRDLTAVTLFDLYRDLGLAVEQPTKHKQVKKAWAKRFSHVQEALTKATTQALSPSLAEFLAQASPNEFAANDTDETDDVPTGEELASEEKKMRWRLLALLGIGAASSGT